MVLALPRLTERVIEWGFESMTVVVMLVAELLRSHIPPEWP